MAKERLRPKAFLPTKEKWAKKANEKMNEMHDWAYEQNNKANEYFVNSDELSCNSYTLFVWVKKENNKAYEHLVNSDALTRNSYELSVRVKK